MILIHYYPTEMDEKLKNTINKIRLLSQQNEEFAQELRKLFEKTAPAIGVSVSSDVADDVKFIREALGIRGNYSITYDFIKVPRLRDQLRVDNLRMENAALDLQQSEKDRFYVFCVNAFYQVENILNYYYHINYPQVKELVDVIEKWTASEDANFQFKRTGKEQNVSNINAVDKINAYCNEFIDDPNYKLRIGTLRQVRNEGEHRWSNIDKAGNTHLSRFFKLNTINNIRADLIKLVDSVQKEIDRVSTIESEIKSMLPGACFVSLNGKSEQLSVALFNKIKTEEKGTKIVLSMQHGKIIDVNLKK